MQSHFQKICLNPAEVFLYPMSQMAYLSVQGNQGTTVKFSSPRCLAVERKAGKDINV